jgi:hypothetical protein
MTTKGLKPLAPLGWPMAIAYLVDKRKDRKTEGER